MPKGVAFVPIRRRSLGPSTFVSRSLREDVRLEAGLDGTFQPTIRAPDTNRAPHIRSFLLPSLPLIPPFVPCHLSVGWSELHFRRRGAAPCAHCRSRSTLHWDVCPPVPRGLRGGNSTPSEPNRRLRLRPSRSPSSAATPSPILKASTPPVGPASLPRRDPGRRLPGGPHSQRSSSDIASPPRPTPPPVRPTGCFPPSRSFRRRPLLRCQRSLVAFDQSHRVSIIASLAIGNATNTIVVSRSSDAHTWADPMRRLGDDSDKQSITCDNNPGSQFFGHCSIE